MRVISKDGSFIPGLSRDKNGSLAVRDEAALARLIAERERIIGMQLQIDALNNNIQTLTALVNKLVKNG
jgi:hypothetical protein